MLVGVVIVSLGLVVGLTTAKSSAPTATPSKTVNPYYSEDYALGARYGQALKNNGDYQNSEINGLCFTLYSRLDEFKYHVDGSLVAEEDFVSGCFTNAVH